MPMRPTCSPCVASEAVRRRELQQFVSGTSAERFVDEVQSLQVENHRQHMAVAAREETVAAFPNQRAVRESLSTGWVIE
jgi:hypothetical protein